MSQKHTPGPWMVSDEPSDIRCFVGVASDLGAYQGDIAEMHFQPSRNGPTQRANAHLIAAAPDLLGAAQYAADIIQGGDKFDKLEPWAQDIVKRLRDAIAKATI
jgi:hypothetical protein